MLSTIAESNRFLLHFLPQMNPKMKLMALNKQHIQKRMMNPPNHVPSSCTDVDGSSVSRQ